MAARIERSIGGAGTGKTRLLIDSLSRAKRELGLSVDEIGFCTFTRAGRQEIAERAGDAWGVDPEVLTKSGWFKTAHAIAYKQSGVEEGQLITGKDGDEWMSAALGGSINTRIDARGERTYIAGGDDTIPAAMRAWELARSTVKPLAYIVDRWASAGEPCPTIEEVIAIIDRYETAKKRDGRLDYTDMIARFAGVKYHVKGSPEMVDPLGDVPAEMRVIAIDEAQDSSALVDLVCRRLASSDKIERVWLTGDPYQSIHGFAGGDYRHFLSWDAIESIMPQSYRCPQRVLDLGELCLQRMSSGYRKRNIKPASHEGLVLSVETSSEALSMIPKDGTTLILGRCAYSLSDYEEFLKQEEVPHCWIDKSHGNSVLSGYNALWKLQNGQVADGESWGNAVAMLGVNSKEHGPLLRRGEKAAWADGRRTDIDFVRPGDEHMIAAGAEPALIGLIREGRWHLAVEPKSRERAEHWLRTATRHGPEEASNPRVRLSTIHGAKGLEADTVILSTITSPRIERARVNLVECHDEECRIEYVAVTRTRRNLICVNDGFKHRMELPL